jgi:hypothetical protein
MLKVARFDIQLSAGQNKASLTKKEALIKRRRSKYDKNRNGFSSLKENWTGSTGSSG